MPCSRLWRVWLQPGHERHQHEAWGLPPLLSENGGGTHHLGENRPEAPEIGAAWVSRTRPACRCWADSACLPNAQFSTRVPPSASSGSHCPPPWLACRETRGRMLGSSRPGLMRVLVTYGRWRKGLRGSCDCLLSASLPCPALCPGGVTCPAVNCRRHRLEGGGQREGGVSLPAAPQLPAASQWLYPLDSARAEGPSGQPPSRGPASLVRALQSGANRRYRLPCRLVPSGPEAPSPTPPCIFRYALSYSWHTCGSPV